MAVDLLLCYNIFGPCCSSGKIIYVHGCILDLEFLDLRRKKTLFKLLFFKTLLVFVCVFGLFDFVFFPFSCTAAVPTAHSQNSCKISLFVY